MEKVEGVLDTEEKVRNARQTLEEATEDCFRRYDRAKRKTWAKSRYILLD